MTEYKLGDKVTVSGCVKRVRDTINWPDDLPFNSEEIAWSWETLRGLPCETLDFEKKAVGRTRYMESSTKVEEGYIIGKRTLPEGITDDGLFFYGKPLRVYLVVFEMFQNPIRCLPEQISKF